MSNQDENKSSWIDRSINQSNDQSYYWGKNQTNKYFSILEEQIFKKDLLVRKTEKI
jgi:hypothetical protein